MWICDNWKDYELLDASSGERLERWGDYILVRPDPQIIWKTPRLDPRWKSAHGVYKRRGGGGAWTVANMPEMWTINYGAYKFQIKPMGFKHTGIFPEQAANWDWASGIIRKAVETEPQKYENGRPTVLNLFAYTGGATVACAEAGASLCHVDASKGMVAAAKENMRLSGLADSPCRYIVDDCRKFVEREIRRGRKYDAVIMDPPSYGRGPNGEVWKLEECAAELIELVAQVLCDEPLFFLINSYTTGLSPATMGYMLMTALGERGKKGRLETGETGIPVKNSGLVLPSGASARWTVNRIIK
ncbi:MAG: class I SAM-dependent methyltransferase [Clostridia bacterium]|nr:class I SAM-dependent methyltransferase [Clostridia bacterium]